MSKQMTHFRNGQGKEGSGMRSRIKPRWGLYGKGRASQGDGLSTDSGQEGMSQHHQRDMAIPADEAAHLVVIQSQIFGRFKIFLDMPACPDGRHHLLQRGPWWSKDEVVGLLLRIGEAATNEQPMVSILFPLMQDGHGCPVKEPGAFGPFTHREALPILVMQQESFHFADFHPSASPIRSHYPNGFIAGDRQHVGIAMRLQPGAQVQVAAIDRIGHHPGDGDRSLPEALHHLNRQFRFGLEAHRLRDACSLTPIMILDPVERQIEFAVNEGMSLGRDVGEKDADLTVLDLSGRPAVLHLDARRLSSRAWESWFRR